MRPADDNNQVLTVEGGKATYRKKPCGGCPWRVDQTGQFPAKAFEHSAPTSYDAAMTTFACHESGAEKPATCAGFLLRNSEHNLMVRIKQSSGDIDMEKVEDAGIELHDSYRAMAVANGVDPDHPTLKECRP